MVFEDNDCKMYDLFIKEYRNSNYGFWEDFILGKDIGVKYMQFDRYAIIDQKKWMITKLKYGI
jgi:hypothetical protein